MLTEKVRAARVFAREQHEGQRRKHGPDYDIHPEDVASVLLIRCGIEDEDVICAALLHDVIEEGETDAGEIAQRFGSRVSDMVVALTRDKHRPYREYAQQLGGKSRDVVLIKAADVFCNLRDSALADASTRRRAIRIAERYILPLATGSLGNGHRIVRDLEEVLRAVRKKRWSLFV